MISPVTLAIPQRNFYNPIRVDKDTAPLPQASQLTTIKQLPALNETVGASERMPSSVRELVMQTALATWAPFVAMQELRKEEDKKENRSEAYSLAIA